MSLNDVTFLVYSHTCYDDILEINLDRHKQFFPEMNITICTNNKEFIESKYLSKYTNISNIIQYDDTQPFGEKLRYVTSKVETKYLIFQQDINIFFKKVNVDKILECLDFAEKNNVDQLRLIVSGVNNPIFNDTLVHNLESGYIYSVYPAIWKTSTLLDVATKFNLKQYREFECEEVFMYLKNYNNYYMSSKMDKSMNPWWYALWIPEYYPICHVISSGKWFNKLDLYQEIIDNIIKEYSIDVHKRGYS